MEKRFMYILKTEASFDSAHFLAGYNGKCSNLHGHRWKIVLEVQTEELNEDDQHKGMYVDFGELKKDLRNIAGVSYTVTALMLYPSIFIFS